MIQKRRCWNHEVFHSKPTMPLRGIERDNVANEISEEPNSERHYVSFEFYPFHEGMTFAVYKGLLSTESRRGKTFCVVKALLDAEVDAGHLFNDVIIRAKEAQRLASLFNSIVGYKAVTFQLPSLAQIQQISDFVGLFRCVVAHEKRLQKYETVVIEEFVEGNFVIFNTSNGTVPSNNQNKHQPTKTSGKKFKLKTKTRRRERTTGCSKDSSFPIGSNNLAQAFSHFTWHETNSLVVCDLKGVFNDNTYVFSNPTIHSLDSTFGSSDRGTSAISEVFASHRCTNICREWMRFTTQASNVKNQINFCEQFSEQPPQLTASAKSNKNICTHDNKLSA